MTELRQTALEILALSDAQGKVSRVFQLFDDYQQQLISLNLSVVLIPHDLLLPGRPVKPELIRFIPPKPIAIQHPYPQANSGGGKVVSPKL